MDLNYWERRTLRAVFIEQRRHAIANATHESLHAKGLVAEGRLSKMFELTEAGQHAVDIVRMLKPEA